MNLTNNADVNKHIYYYYYYYYIIINNSNLCYYNVQKNSVSNLSMTEELAT